MNRSSAKKTPRAKAKLLKKAEDMMWKAGFTATSVNNLVEAAGVSKGAFFHHFPSKSAIIKDVLNAYADEEILTPLQKHLQEAHSAKNAILDWLQEIYMTSEKRGFTGGCLLGNMAAECADQDEESREAMKALFLSWENTLVNALKPSAADGKLLMEPRQLARLIISQLEGIRMTSRVHRDRNRAAREFMSLAQLIEQLIKD